MSDDNHATTPIDPTVQATQDLKDAMDTFHRVASMVFGPTKIDPVSFSLFQVTLQLRAQRAKEYFYERIAQSLDALIERTETPSGALDARSEARIMARQRIGIAMGPDPDTMRELALASQHELARETDKNLELHEILHAIQSTIGHILESESLTDSARSRLKALTDDTLFETSVPKHDPGEIQP